MLPLIDRKIMIGSLLMTRRRRKRMTRKNNLFSWARISNLRKALQNSINTKKT